MRYDSLDAEYISRPIIGGQRDLQTFEEYRMAFLKMGMIELNEVIGKSFGQLPQDRRPQLAVDMSHGIVIAPKREKGQQQNPKKPMFPNELPLSLIRT